MLVRSLASLIAILLGSVQVHSAVVKAKSYATSITKMETFEAMADSPPGVVKARTIEEAYCNAKPDYIQVNGKALMSCSRIANSQKKPMALDMEIKILTNGEILFKQAREFSGK